MTRFFYDAISHQVEQTTLLPSSMTKKIIKYVIDTVTTQKITGWCYWRLFPTKPIALTIYYGDELLGELVNDEFRQDLIDVAGHPTGRCGFTFSFPESFQLKTDCTLKIYIKSLVPCLLASYEYNQIAQVCEGELPNIFFMHIPKTAGTSFNYYVRQFFPEDTSVTHIEGIQQERAEVFKQYNYIAGHLSLGKLAELNPPDHFTYYTIIREPFKHLHSHLNWVKGVGVDKSSDFYKRHPPVVQKLSIELNSKKNDIKQMLGDFIENLDGFEIDFFDNIQTRYFLDYRPERVSDEDLQAAKNNCSLFKRIGVTESYKDFTIAFCQDNGLRYVEQPKRLNKAKIEPLYDIHSPEIQEILLPLVKADLALYDYVTNSL